MLLLIMSITIAALTIVCAAQWVLLGLYRKDNDKYMSILIEHGYLKYDEDMDCMTVTEECNCKQETVDLDTKDKKNE